MPDVATLLPSNATAGERALEQATARIAAVPVMPRLLWNPQTCPAALLPWLAWAFRVTEWDSNWPEETQRAVIAASIPLHRIKGSYQSIIMALDAAGYPSARVVEGAPTFTYNGAVNFDGSHNFGDASQWASYKVVLSAPISNSQADQVKRILADTAPARCYLTGLDFTQAAFIYDGSVKFDGTYNYGIA